MFGGAVLLVNTLRSDLGKGLSCGRVSFWIYFRRAGCGMGSKEGSRHDYLISRNRAQDGWTRGQLTRR
jgi:hypothetical protein